MNGERCRDANLLFEPSMRRADVALTIVIIEMRNHKLQDSQFW